MVNMIILNWERQHRFCATVYTVKLLVEVYFITEPATVTMWVYFKSYEMCATALSSLKNVNRNKTGWLIVLI